MKVADKLQPLLDQLLSVSQELRKQVLADQDEVEEWSSLIEQREEIIKQINDLQNQGQLLRAEDKQNYLQKVYEIDLEITPLLNQKYEELDRQSKNIQKSRMVGAKYGSYGNINPYGAYFDKKN
ncbi:hypothetical protein [Brevibacillus centrosporus]|nr:hypothetical protein [Brevibacillus centrosporus]